MAPQFLTSDTYTHTYKHSNTLWFSLGSDRSFVLCCAWGLGQISAWLNGICYCEILKKFACEQIENVSNVKQSRQDELTLPSTLPLRSTNWICSTVCGAIKAATLRACPAPQPRPLCYFMSSPRSAVNMLGKQPARRLRQDTVHGPHCPQCPQSTDCRSCSIIQMPVNGGWNWLCSCSAEREDASGNCVWADLFDIFLQFPLEFTDLARQLRCVIRAYIKPAIYEYIYSYI